MHNHCKRMLLLTLIYVFFSAYFPYCRIILIFNTCSNLLTVLCCCVSAQQATSPQSSANTSETYSLPNTNEYHSSVDTSLAETESQNESPKRLPTPPEGGDFKLEGLTSTPNMVTSLQRTDLPSPPQPVCEGSFVGRARHKDGSLLGIIFQVSTMHL